MNAPKPLSGPSPIPKVNSQRLPVTGGVVFFVFWSPCGFMPPGDFFVSALSFATQFRSVNVP